jgi:hypothetical protein
MWAIPVIVSTPESKFGQLELEFYQGFCKAPGKNKTSFDIMANYHLVQAICLP